MLPDLYNMKALLIISLLLITSLGVAQTKTTVRDKSGHITGYIKEDKKGNKTFYNKSGHKVGKSKKINKNTTYYYDKSGHKIGSTKEKANGKEK